MVFSSPSFLYFFLIIALALYYVTGQKLKNVVLLFISLAFYFIGEKGLVLLMVGSILGNYLGGMMIAKYKNQRNTKKRILFIFVIFNLSLLFYYKYFLFVIKNIQLLGFGNITKYDSIIMPVGISFFTFQGISYIIDVYRKPAIVQNNLVNLGLYISLFPQLIAGPIIRYEDIEPQLKYRKNTLDKITQGLTRFIRGFAKKILIANEMGAIADSVFSVPLNELSTSLAWIGILTYTLQIYFDFSGYSDMAIGLGKLFGFDFKENFNYPYISRSIREFWRRWHISLSTWFKDYLYIPLGGSRSGTLLTYRNLIIVFVATGVWHGANWTFLVWGLYYGLFLILERVVVFSFKWPTIFKHIYVLLVVIIGWVLFKSTSIVDALQYLKVMFISHEGMNFEPYLLISNYVIFIFMLGVIYSMPLKLQISGFMKNRLSKKYYLIIRYGFYLVLLVFAMSQMAQGGFNPFIYFRF